MQRFIVAAIVVLMLADCARQPAPPPTPDAAAQFEAAYAAVTDAYNAISARMDGADIDARFADAAFRTEVQALAGEWRSAASAVHYMAQPAGDKWERAWPRIADAMTIHMELATMIEVAARENNPMLLISGAGRLDLATALLDEAMGILGE